MPLIERMRGGVTMVSDESQNVANNIFQPDKGFESEDELATQIESIVNSSDLSADEVGEKVQNLSRFSVPLGEAVKTVRNQVSSSDKDDNAEPETVTFDEIDTGDMPVNVDEAIVVNKRNSTSSKIKQKGSLFDGTTTLGFIEFAGGSHQTLNPGDVVSIENAKTDEFNGNFSIQFNDSTTIENVSNPSVAAEDATLSEVVEEGEFLNVGPVEVVDVWESRSDAVAQTGLLADDTDRIKYTQFSGTGDVPTFEEGDVFTLDGVVVDEYEGNFSLQIQDVTELERTDVEVDTDSANKNTFMAPIVNLNSGSGLVRRCNHEDEDGSTCTRIVDNKPCPDHGTKARDGTNDLRIKATADTGSDTVTLIFDREMTEEITDTTFDEAMEIVREQMDRDVISTIFAEKLLGRYYHFETVQFGGDNELVQDFEPVDTDIEEQAERLNGLLNKVIE